MMHSSVAMTKPLPFPLPSLILLSARSLWESGHLGKIREGRGKGRGKGGGGGGGTPLGEGRILRKTRIIDSCVSMGKPEAVSQLSRTDALIQAPHMDNSVLSGSPCMCKCALYVPYASPVHGHVRPLRVSMHEQLRHLRALYRPCTWTIPPSPDLYA